MVREYSIHLYESRVFRVLVLALSVVGRGDARQHCALFFLSRQIVLVLMGWRD